MEQRIQVVILNESLQQPYMVASMMQSIRARTKLPESQKLLQTSFNGRLPKVDPKVFGSWYTPAVFTGNVVRGNGGESLPHICRSTPFKV